MSHLGTLLLVYAPMVLRVAVFLAGLVYALITWHRHPRLSTIVTAGMVCLIFSAIYSWVFRGELAKQSDDSIIWTYLRRNIPYAVVSVAFAALAVRDKGCPHSKTGESGAQEERSEF